VEHRAASTFPLGSNPGIKAIRLTLDPVRVLSRPLVLYGFVWMLAKLMMVNARRHGFREITDDDTRYLIRVPEGWKPDSQCKEAFRPLLFIHGLGSKLPNRYWTARTALMPGVALLPSGTCSVRHFVQLLVNQPRLQAPPGDGLDPASRLDGVL
jgi:hypothetical protein